MNAIAHPRRAVGARLAPFGIVLAAGGWTSALVLVLGVVAGLLLSALTGPGHGQITLLLALPAMFTMFWAMLTGGRLLAMCISSAALRLPQWRGQALRCGLAAVAIGVVLPAAVIALVSPTGFALAVAALAVGMGIGLFWASMPPWSIFVLFPAGLALDRLADGAGSSAISMLLRSPAMFLAGLALVSLAASALCWWWLSRYRGAALGAWSRPLAIAFTQSTRQLLEQGQQDNWNSRLFALDTPVGSDLRHHPQQALAIALGPGFGRGTLRNVLATQGPIVAVAVFWLLRGNTTGGRGHIGLAFAPLMVLSTAFAPMIRLQTLFWRPALGLHELALLPGLPARPAPSLAAQLGRQAIVRSLPALAVMAGFGLAVDAPRGYYLMLMWTCAGSLFLMSGATLLSLRSRPGRWACAALVVALILGLMATMLATMRGDPPSWLHTAWSLVLIAGVVLQGAALARLRALPHPWLQN